MRKANKQADDCRFNIHYCWVLDRYKPIIIIEGIEEKTDDRIKFAGVLVSIDKKDQNQEFNYSCQADSVNPVQHRIARKGHVKVLKLHEKVACMRYIQHHKDKGTMEYGLLTFEIGHYMVHIISIKVVKL